VPARRDIGIFNVILLSPAGRTDRYGVYSTGNLAIPLTA